MTFHEWVPTSALCPDQGAARAALRTVRLPTEHRLSACRARLLALGTTLLTAVVVSVVWWGYSRAIVGHQADGSSGAEPSPPTGGRAPAASRGGLPAALAAPLVPIVPLQFTFDPAAWASAILDAIAGALTTFIGTLFKNVIIEFLILDIPKSPAQYPNTAMNAAYSQNLQYAVMLLPLVVLLGLAVTPVSRRDRAALRRQLWRLILVFVGLGAAQPFLRLTGQVVNVTTQLIAPQKYAFGFGGQLMSNGLESIVGSGLVVALGLILIDLGIILIGVLVLGFLYLRQFLFQMVYIGFPFLVLAWYLDWGPLRYSKQIANLVFSITGLLVVLGPVIALGLQTGCVVAGAQSASGCFTGSATVSQSSANAPDLWRRFLGWATGLALAMVLPMRIGRMVGMPMGVGGGGGSGASGSGGGASAGSGGGDGGGQGESGGGTSIAAAEGGSGVAETTERAEVRPPQAAEHAASGARQRAENLAEDAHTMADIGRDIGASTAQWGGRVAKGAGSAAATATGYASESAEATMRDTGQQANAVVGGRADRVRSAAGTTTEGAKAVGGKARAAVGKGTEMTPEPAKSAVKTVGGAAYVASREAVTAGKFIHNNPRAGVKTMSKHAIGRVRSQQWSMPTEGGVSPSGAGDDPRQATIGDYGADVPQQEVPHDDVGSRGRDDADETQSDDVFDWHAEGDDPPPRTIPLDNEWWSHRTIQSTLDPYLTGSGGGTDGGGGGGGEGGGSDGGGGGDGRGGGRTGVQTASQESEGPDYTQDQVDAASGDLSEFWDDDF